MAAPISLESLRRRGVVFDVPPDASAIHDDVRIEGPASIAAATSFRWPLKVGAFSHLNGGFIQNVTIGRYCSFARDVQIGHGCHPTTWLSVSPLQYVDDYRGWPGFAAHHQGTGDPLVTQAFAYQHHTIIGHDVWMGNHAIVKDGISIGTGAVVGAGSVVTHDVPPYAIVAGNPARVLRMRFDDRLIARLLALQWWAYALHSFGPIDFSDPQRAVEILEQRLPAVEPFHAPTITAVDIRALQQWAA